MKVGTRNGNQRNEGIFCRREHLPNSMNLLFGFPGHLKPQSRGHKGQDSPEGEG